MAANDVANLGPFTHFQIQKQRDRNAEAGHGLLSTAEWEGAQREAQSEIASNAAAGYGAIRNDAAEAQRRNSIRKGFGRITDAEADWQRSANRDAGLGLVRGCQCILCAC